MEIEVTPPGDGMPNEWTVKKLKSGPGGASHRFRLRQMTVGHNDEGKPTTSCVVVGESETNQPGFGEVRGIKLPGTEMAFLRVLCAAIERHGVLPPRDLEVGRRTTLVVAHDHVRTLYWDTLAGTEGGTKEQIHGRLKTAWSRATKSCVAHGVVGFKGTEWIWLTGREVYKLDMRGVDHVSSQLSAVTETGEEAPF
jgi:hypothetical protein